MALHEKAFFGRPRITANFIMANPISDGEGNLAYIPFHQAATASIQPPAAAWQQAISKGWLYPQLHGYSHFNRRILERVARSPEGRTWAQQGALTLLATVKGRIHLLPGEFLAGVPEVVAEFKKANDAFQEFFGFASLSVIPPRYGLNKQALASLHANGLKLLQASSNSCNERQERHLFIWGRKHHGILMIPRLVRLDPYPEYGYYAKEAIANIEKCFRLGIPACIDMHRVNFSSRFQPGQRDRFLEELHTVVHCLKVHHPDTQFLTTPELLQEYAS